ncbi:MAG: type II toxin-antitoxin system RelE/ParE family toxin, partial [Planctomycetes bacterium]|nr:type II toxin-antitoxin system RelE/ParE family toxin [Planctomycetota bacterium]
MPYRKIQNLELSSFAQLDIEDILQYTFVNHGLMQVDKYLNTLMQAMVLISENSNIGHKRDDLPDNYKAWSVEKHIIVYKLKGQISIDRRKPRIEYDGAVYHVMSR